MINITVFSNKLVDIENDSIHIEDKEDMTQFLQKLLDKVKYSGEAICLEEANIVDNLVTFSEIDRW